MDRIAAILAQPTYRDLSTREGAFVTSLNTDDPRVAEVDLRMHGGPNTRLMRQALQEIRMRTALTQPLRQRRDYGADEDDDLPKGTAMNAQELRKATIRLAHENPDLRPHLLPLLTAKAADDEDESDKESRFEEGKEISMDEMTKDMSPEDKKKFEANKEKYGDKFKDKKAAEELFKATVRLAHAKPELREHLLPLLTAAKAADDDAPEPEPETKDEPEAKDDEGSDKEAALRSATIRLAHANPELRAHLLPLIKAADEEKEEEKKEEGSDKEAADKAAMAITEPLQALGIDPRSGMAMIALARGAFGRAAFESHLTSLGSKHARLSRDIWNAIQTVL